MGEELTTLVMGTVGFALFNTEISLLNLLQQKVKVYVTSVKQFVTSEADGIRGRRIIILKSI